MKPAACLKTLLSSALELLLKPTSRQAMLMDFEEKKAILDSAGYDDYSLRCYASGKEPVWPELFDEVVSTYVMRPAKESEERM